MSRNKTILNLKKLSNTVGKSSELEVNPETSKKRIPETWALRQFSRPQMRHLCDIFLACMRAWRRASSGGLAHERFCSFKQRAFFWFLLESFSLLTQWVWVRLARCQRTRPGRWFLYSPSAHSGLHLFFCPAWVGVNYWHSHWSTVAQNWEKTMRQSAWPQVSLNVKMTNSAVFIIFSMCWQRHRHLRFSRQSGGNLKSLFNYPFAGQEQRYQNYVLRN